MIGLTGRRRGMAVIATVALAACDSGDRSWVMTDKADTISGAASYEADATAVADDGSRFLLSASCKPGFATISVSAKDEKKIAASAENGGAIATLRLRFDDGPEKQSPAILGSGSAVFLFHDRDFAGAFIARGVAAPEPLAKAMSGAGSNGMTGAAVERIIGATSAVTTQQLYASDLLKIEVPLENGKKPVISVSLKAGDFPKFVARCGADQQKIMTNAEKEKYERLKNTLTVSGYMKSLKAALKEQTSDAASYEEDLKKLTGFMTTCAQQAQTVNDQHLTQAQDGAAAQGRNCHTMPPVKITKPGVKRPLFLYSGVIWDEQGTSVHFQAKVFTSDPDEPQPDKYPAVQFEKKPVLLVDSDVVPD